MYGQRTWIVLLTSVCEDIVRPPMAMVVSTMSSLTPLANVTTSVDILELKKQRAVQVYRVQSTPGSVSPFVTQVGVKRAIVEQHDQKPIQRLARALSMPSNFRTLA